MTDSTSIPQHAITPTHPVATRILEKLDHIPALLSSKLLRLSEQELAHQNAKLVNIRDEIENIKSQYATRKQLAIESSRIGSLQSRIKSVTEDMKTTNAAIEEAQCAFMGLSDECGRWPDEKQKLEEELRIMKANIEAHRGVQFNKPDASAKIPDQRDAVPCKSPEDEYMGRIFALQSSIRKAKTRLERSRINPGLTERIRLVHVCRGVIETTTTFSAETKSKLLSLLNS